MKTLRRIAMALVIIGAINWGLVGLFRFDLVGALFGGTTSGFARLIFTLVGISGIVALITQFMGESQSQQSSQKSNESSQRSQYSQASSTTSSDKTTGSDSTNSGLASGTNSGSSTGMGRTASGSAFGTGTPAFSTEFADEPNEDLLYNPSREAYEGQKSSEGQNYQKNDGKNS